MADTEKKFSELNSAGTLDGTEILAMSQTVSGSLMSVKDTLQAIANWFAINSQYTSALNTTSKTLTGAINELKQLISLIPQFSIEVVQTLPTEDISDTTIYLVPSSNPETENAYNEFIHVNNTWEQVGSTAVDLSAYYTKLEADAKYPVTFTNVAASSTTAKKVADVTQNGVTTSLYADDAEKVLKKILNEEHTVTGNPISFDAWLGLEYAKSCEVAFAPIQDLHGYDYPWPGGSGKNLVEITKTGSITANGITWTVNLDGTITANGTATATSVFLLKQTTDYGKDLQPNTEYIISSGYGNSDVWFGLYYDNSSNWGVTVANDGERTFTTISDFNYVRFGIRIGNGATVNNVTFKPMVRLSTISDSTFAPYSNICPISGRDNVDVVVTGKNLFGGTPKYPNKVIASDGSLSDSNSYDTYEFKGGVSYVLNLTKGSNFDTLRYCRYVNGVGERLTKSTFPITIDATNYDTLRITLGKNNFATDIQLEIGETATDYVAYDGQTHTATFPDTVYGGKAVWNGDGSCKAIIEWVAVDMGSVDYTSNDAGKFRYRPSNGIISGEVGSLANDFMCSIYKNQANVVISSANVGNLQVAKTSSNTYSSYYFRDDVYSTIEQFKTAMSGQTFAYKLATPQEITLSAEQIALLKGQNVLWTDGDSVKLVYSADIKAYIDSQLQS